MFSSKLEEPCQSRCIVARSDLLLACVDNESVVLEPATGCYFSLNAVASELLNVMMSPCSLDSLARFVSERFGILSDRAYADVQEYAEQLVQSGLASWVQSEPNE